MFAGDELGQFVLVLIQQRLEVEQDAGALERGVSDQAGNAALAAATASATSSLDASGMDEQISPVAGLKPSA